MYGQSVASFHVCECHRKKKIKDAFSVLRANVLHWEKRKRRKYASSSYVSSCEPSQPRWAYFHWDFFLPLDTNVFHFIYLFSVYFIVCSVPNMYFVIEWKSTVIQFMKRPTHVEHQMDQNGSIFFLNNIPVLIFSPRYSQEIGTQPALEQRKSAYNWRQSKWSDVCQGVQWSLEGQVLKVEKRHTCNEWSSSVIHPLVVQTRTASSEAERADCWAKSQPLLRAQRNELLWTYTHADGAEICSTRVWNTLQKSNFQYNSMLYCACIGLASLM